MGQDQQNGTHVLGETLEERNSSSMGHGFLFVAVVLAFGALCGIGIFYSIFYHQFSELLLETELRHNETLEILKGRLDFAISEKNECLDDDTKDSELGALRARLSLSGNVASKYEKLVDKYDLLLEREKDLNDRLQEHQTALQQKTQDLEAVSTENSQLDGVIQKQKRILETLSEENKGLMEKLRSASTESSNSRRRVMEFERRFEELDFNLAQCENEVSRIRHSIQARQLYSSKEEYGKGPYYVQITLKAQHQADPMSFVVELASRKILPHTVFTFLSLVEYQLYDGTILSLRDVGSMVTSTANEEHEYVLKKKLKTLGMEEFILMFRETSPQFPCGENSIGFDWLAPSMEIYLDPRNESDEFKSCFGKVVRGFEALTAAKKSLSEGQQIDVVQARYLEL